MPKNNIAKRAEKLKERTEEIKEKWVTLNDGKHQQRINTD